MDYKTVYQETAAEIVEKKSRFIASVFPVSSHDRAMECLGQVKKQHWSARHHCWAYIVGVENSLERFSDDGEPGGTAGRPILEVIKGYGLSNLLIVVTRYFGGTLLGTGGLVRAYTAASREGLAHSKIITRIWGFKLTIGTNYTDLGKIQYILAQNGAEVLETSYTDIVEITVLISEKGERPLIAHLTEATNGKGHINRKKGCYIDSFES